MQPMRFPWWIFRIAIVAAFAWAVLGRPDPALDIDMMVSLILGSTRTIRADGHRHGDAIKE